MFEFWCLGLWLLFPAIEIYIHSINTDWYKRQNTDYLSEVIVICIALCVICELLVVFCFQPTSLASIGIWGCKWHIVDQVTCLGCSISYRSKWRRLEDKNNKQLTYDTQCNANNSKHLGQYLNKTLFFIFQINTDIYDEQRLNMRCWSLQPVSQPTVTMSHMWYTHFMKCT